ncbi:MAG TPA: hypothetical protein VF459_18140 [Caulobacteraceae bacterium]
MTLPIHASSTALAATVKAKPTHEPNPAHQARAEHPDAKGADFGALVASLAKTRGDKPAPVTLQP